VDEDRWLLTPATAAVIAKPQQRMTRGLTEKDLQPED
jgi:hypothetical protein